VGTLFLDVERNIQFEPETINYLLDAFGLASFQSPAIKRDAIAKRIEKEFKDRKAIPAEKRKINIKRYVALAIAAPLLFAMVWIPLKTDLLKTINYSNLNPFSFKEIKDSKTTKVLPIVVHDTIITKLPSSVKQLPAITETNVMPVKADTTAVVKVIDDNLDYKFHLVTGCFQIEENAVKYVAALQQQNLSASIIGQNEKGLYVVSCGDFPTRKHALKELINLRKLQPNAWLYKN
jgi:hypothetical protein